MKSNTPKNQHFVAKAYLDGWLFNKNQVYYFQDKGEKFGEPRNPSSCLKERHVYTIDFDTLILLRDCTFIKNDFVTQIDEILKARNIYAKYDNEIQDFSNNFLLNNYCLDKWEFYYKTSNNRASSVKVMNQIKGLKSYILERELSKRFENQWKDKFNNFLVDIKYAKHTLNNDRIILFDNLNGIMQFAIITMMRNPKSDPFGLYEFEEKIYERLPIEVDEDKKIRWIKARFLERVYRILFNSEKNVSALIEDIYNNGEYKITLFKASQGSSFITSDNCSFINDGDFRGMIFPLSARFLLVVRAGKKSKINEIQCMMLEPEKVKEYNRMIFDNAIYSVISNVRYLPNIL